MVTTTRFEISSKGQGDCLDVSRRVQDAVSASGATAGIVTVFIAGSTAGVTTIEFEPGAVSDLNELLEELAPRRAEYHHHARWGDDNGSSHVRAALVGPSITVPFSGKALMLGTWQQIVVLEFDTQPRQRECVVQVIGE